MPHVIVKLQSGRTGQQKANLAREVTKAVVTALKIGEDSVSVAVEDVEPSDWTETVYKPYILGKSHMICKNPGYNPL